jgi:hypothetical protein
VVASSTSARDGTKKSRPHSAVQPIAKIHCRRSSVVLTRPRIWIFAALLHRISRLDSSAVCPQRLEGEETNHRHAQNHFKIVPKTPPHNHLGQALPHYSSSNGVDLHGPRPATIARMCYQVMYKLQCEHILTQIIYCADATVEPGTSSTSSMSGGGGGRGGAGGHRSSLGNSKSSTSTAKPSSKHKSGSSPPSKPHHHHHRHHNHHSKASSASSSPAPGANVHKRPCANLQTQSLPYPTPPSFAANPAMFVSSPLSPRCPLGDCPFEAKNRCWECCWCGKGWNETARCGCVMIVDGSRVTCEHLCCSGCRPAATTTPGGGGAAPAWEGGGYV